MARDTPRDIARLRLRALCCYAYGLVMLPGVALVWWYLIWGRN